MVTTGDLRQKKRSFGLKVTSFCVIFTLLFFSLPAPPVSAVIYEVANPIDPAIAEEPIGEAEADDEDIPGGAVFGAAEGALAVAAPPLEITGDLDDDGRITHQDYEIWRENLGTKAEDADGEPLTGDLNENGHVDFEDYFLMAQSFLEQEGFGSDLLGDLNNDGKLNRADFAQLKTWIDSADLDPAPFADLNFDGTLDESDREMLIIILTAEGYGDLWKNGEVNFAESFLQAFNSGIEASHPGWDPQYDLNADLSTDFKDYSILVQKFYWQNGFSDRFAWDLNGDNKIDNLDLHDLESGHWFSLAEESDWTLTDFNFDGAYDFYDAEILAAFLNGGGVYDGYGGLYDPSVDFEGRSDSRDVEVVTTLINSLVETDDPEAVVNVITDFLAFSRTRVPTALFETLAVAVLDAAERHNLVSAAPLEIIDLIFLNRPNVSVMILERSVRYALNSGLLLDFSSENYNTALNFLIDHGSQRSYDFYRVKPVSSEILNELEAGLKQSLVGFMSAFAAGFPELGDRLAGILSHAKEAMEWFDLTDNFYNNVADFISEFLPDIKAVEISLPAELALRLLESGRVSAARESALVGYVIDGMSELRVLTTNSGIKAGMNLLRGAYNKMGHIFRFSEFAANALLPTMLDFAESMARDHPEYFDWWDLDLDADWAPETSTLYAYVVELYEASHTANVSVFDSLIRLINPQKDDESPGTYDSRIGEITEIFEKYKILLVGGLWGTTGTWRELFSIMKKTFSELPELFLNATRVITLAEGFGGWATRSWIGLKLNGIADIFTDDDTDLFFREILIHEMAHAVNLNSPLTDWTNDLYARLHRNSGVDRNNYISNYANASPWEDFAEVVRFWGNSSIEPLLKAVAYAEDGKTILLEKILFVASVFREQVAGRDVVLTYRNKTEGFFSSILPAEFNASGQITFLNLGSEILSLRYDKQGRLLRLVRRDATVEEQGEFAMLRMLAAGDLNEDGILSEEEGGELEDQILARSGAILDQSQDDLPFYMDELDMDRNGRIDTEDKNLVTILKLITKDALARDWNFFADSVSFMPMAAERINALSVTTIGNGSFEVSVGLDLRNEHPDFNYTFEEDAVYYLDLNTASIASIIYDPDNLYQTMTINLFSGYDIIQIESNHDTGSFIQQTYVYYDGNGRRTSEITTSTYTYSSADFSFSLITYSSRTFDVATGYPVDLYYYSKWMINGETSYYYGHWIFDAALFRFVLANPVLAVI